VVFGEDLEAQVKQAEELAKAQNAEQWFEWFQHHLDCYQNCLLRAIAHSFIRGLLPRQTGAKDSLTSTMMKSLPNNPVNVAAASLVGLGTSFACAISVTGISTFLFQHYPNIFTHRTRVVNWLPVTWDYVAGYTISLLPHIAAFPFSQLLPSMLAQGRFKGIKLFIREELLENWRTHLSLTFFTLPFDLLLTPDLEHYFYERIFSFDDEEEEEAEDPEEPSGWQKRLRRTAFHIAFSGLLSLVEIPSEVIIAHVLSGEEKYNTVTKCVTSLWAEGGLLAFYRSAFPLSFAFSCMSGTLYSYWR